ncbi:MAG TPA: helix-turn-helix transcriptional regulator [Streptomyces sp.]|uniref:helix-turn-helix domain-containing protein n=1 Tax=Streptomyces sp. TaxID=1931 RepID=UPI002D37174C|nr:helix-turn-helix transcriptional regulator [Streptomyces sp.]HZG04161.1 helix-turn-helix transcriptional regulator [Streptomyces sp.]
MPAPDDEHIGSRIAAQRKRAGLTQRGLAQRIPYSYSLLRHVESGHKKASPQLVAAVARALRIDVAVLTGHPEQHPLRPDRVAALVRPIREALDLYDLPTDPREATASAADLIAAADALCRDVREARLYQAAASLPGLLTDLTVSCRERPGTELWRAMASACRSAHDVATKLGHYDLAVIALDRMGWAADRAGDPLLGAVRQYKRALSYRSRDAQHRIGLRMVDYGHALVGQAERGTEALAVAGQLHLGAAVIAARAGDRSAVEEHLAQAGETAARTGEVGAVHWLSFGPANVGAHEVFARLELREFDEALAVARAVRPPRGWAASRRAALLVDVARAEMETGRVEASLTSLMKARRLAPQQTRFHPRVRETVEGLLQSRRRFPDTLTRMASWVGV